MRTISPETILEKHLINLGLYEKVKRYKRIQFSVATKDDPTNWSKAQYRMLFSNGLRVKYASQYLNIYLTNTLFRKKLKNKINYVFINIQIKFYRFVSKKLNYVNYHVKKEFIT